MVMKFVASVANKIQSLRDSIASFVMEKNLDDAAHQEAAVLKDYLRNAKQNTDVAAALLSFSDIAQSSPEHTSPLKKYLVTHIDVGTPKAEAEVEAEPKAYEVDNGIEFVRMVSKFTDVPLPGDHSLTLAHDFEWKDLQKLLNKVLAQTQLDRDDKRAFITTVKELHSNGKLSQPVLSLLIVHANNSDMVKLIEKSAQEDNFNFSALLGEINKPLMVNTKAAPTPETEPCTPVSPRSESSGRSTPRSPFLYFRGRPSARVRSLDLTPPLTPTRNRQAENGMLTPTFDMEEENSPSSPNATQECALTRRASMGSTSSPTTTDCPSPPRRLVEALTLAGR